MKKVFWGLTVLALFLGIYANGNPLSTEESFVEKMQPYVGRMLNSNEIQLILVGNTLYRSAENKRGKYRDIFWYYQTKTKLRIFHETKGPGGHDTSWSVMQKKVGVRYCNKTIIAGGKFCRSNIRLSIEDGTVIVKMGKGKRERAFELRQGEHSY